MLKWLFTYITPNPLTTLESFNTIRWSYGLGYIVHP